MDITVEEDVARLKRLPHHHFGRAILRALLHRGRNPLAVQIKATQRGPIVANKASVRVQHRDDFKDEIISQVLGVIVIAHQELQDAFNDETSVRLTRMYPRRDDDSSTHSDVLGP